MTKEWSDRGLEADREVSFAVFFLAHRSGVERLIRWRIGAELAEVDDVCAEVFVIALRRFDWLRDLPTTSARAWLLRVADHRCAHVHRSRSRRRLAYVRVARQTEPDSFDPFDDDYLDRVGDDVPLAERARLVLADLPAAHREVLRLDLEGNLSGRQMAEALGTTEVGGRLRLMRARRAFGAEFVRRFGRLGVHSDEGNS